VSLTAGTVLHGTKTPLTLWFWAAYLMTTDKRGLSALLLQRQLAMRRCETAWLLLHKLRRAMVNAARERLHGGVEVDDTWVGGPLGGLRGSRQLKGRKAALVAVAVEKRATRTAGYRHVARMQPIQTQLRKGAKSVVPLADRAIGNLQQWLIGTHHGVGRHQLQVYLDEFVFRHNRRQTPMLRFRPCSDSGRSAGRLRGTSSGVPTIYRNFQPSTDHNIQRQPESNG
jgi:hypothetical protein